MSESKATPDKKGRSQKGLLIAGGVVLLLVGIYAVMPKGSSSVSQGTTFVVKRGNLDVTITEGGSIEALESQEIRSAVQGRDGVKILSIVEEGYRVTDEDVANGKILVELDSSGLVDELQAQTISLQGSEATYVESQAAYEIQLNQNQSNITAAKLRVKFALMDFNKYLGERAVSEILDDLALDRRAEELDAAINSGAFTVKPELPRLDGSGSNPPSETTGTNSEIPEIVMDSELMEAIGRAMQEAGVPVQPERFRRAGGGETGADGPREVFGGEAGETERTAEGARGGFGGGRPQGDGTISPRMIERMREMGVDVIDIARRLGKLKESTELVEAEMPKTPELPKAHMDPMYVANRAALNFSEYADAERLEDGEAKQRLRQLRDDVLVAEEDLRLAANQLEGQRRLAERQFITQNELELEEVKVKKAEIRLQSAQTSERLYATYEFPKESERLLSDYEESLANLERTVQEAAAKLSQADARLKNAQQRFLHESEELREIEEQLAFCRIKAERTGLVVYGTSTDQGRRGGSQEPIQEGTSVRERQLILTIPDMTKMGVNVSIHEAAVQRVTPNQRARVVVDANPTEPIDAEVVRVAVLPDSTNMWMNPDLKVYRTMLRIPGRIEWIRPGMSAQVEIFVDSLKNVLYVPIQAVSAAGNQRVVYVTKGGQTSMRVVTTGQYTQEFIEITSGIEEGEVILLLPPSDVNREELQPLDEEDIEPSSLPETA
jgi:multidrug resistance efflux pump